MNEKSNAAILKTTFQMLGCATENCLVIKELNKYVYKHIIMIPACIENLPSEAIMSFNYRDLNSPKQTRPLLQVTYSNNVKN